MNQLESGRREFLCAALVAGGCALSGGASAAWAKPPQPPAGLPRVDPKEIRIDPRRLQVVYDLMESWTSGRNAPVPGGAILVGKRYFLPLAYDLSCSLRTKGAKQVWPPWSPSH